MFIEPNTILDIVIVPIGLLGIGLASAAKFLAPAAISGIGSLFSRGSQEDLPLP